MDLAANRFGKTWKHFLEALKVDYNCSLADVCRDQHTTFGGMSSWMSRRGYSVKQAKADVVRDYYGGVAPSQPTTSFPSFTQIAPAMLSEEEFSLFAGESKYPFNKMLNFAIDGITSFSVKPVRMILLVGVLFLLITLGVLVYTLHSLWIGHVVPGWTSLMLSVWFVGAVILISLGIVGEYIGKIYIEVKDRPRYNIESVLLNNEDTEEPDTKTTHD